ncbi:MAG: DNA-directed RNA polymerase subunit alpha C-terminal domain-containing protein [Pseudomonadota bacterium]
MDIHAFEKNIKDYALSEKAQNVLLINDINDYSQFLNINVKNLYYTEKRFKQTIDELLCFQDMLKRKSAELCEGEQLTTDSIGLIQNVNNSKEDIALNAIDKFIDQKDLPQLRHHIFPNLGREFVSDNIAVALSDAETGYKITGDGFYDLLQTWQQMSCNNLIRLLPISVSDFVRYLTSRNHSSYTLVMAFVFIRSMDEDGSISVLKLEDLFYDFYLSRHKNDLVVEKKYAILSQIGILTKDKIKRIACSSPLHYLLASGIFKNISHGRLELKPNFINELANKNVKNLMLITFLKAIDDYYQKISPDFASYEQNPEPPLEIKEFSSPKFKEGYCSKAFSSVPIITSTDNSILNKEKLVDSKDPKYLELVQFVKNTNLSIRAINVITQNCYSIENCYSLNEKSLLDFENCGKKTAYEILDFFETIKPEGDLIPSPTIKEQLESPPTETSLSMLPIFSSTKLEGLTIENLHPDFHSSTKLIDIFLSTRTSHALKTTDVKTIGEILFIPESEFLTWKNFGKKSLNELKDIVRSLCLTGNYSPDNYINKSDFIDYTSYEDMISSFTGQCLRSKRDQKLFQRKFCFQTGKIPTLEELGQHFGITRERVRQIVSKGIRQFRHRLNKNKLEKFWGKLDYVIESGGGIIHLGALPTVLQTELNWQTAPYSLALGQFLVLRHPDANFKDDCDLIIVECECLSCDQILQQLYSLDFTKHESFHIEVVGTKFRDKCQTQCPWDQPVKTFHKAFIERLIDQTEGRLVLHKDLVLSRSNWLNRYCKKLEDVACHVLECYSKPMHFSEIADHIRSQNQNFKEMSDHNVHASIIRYDKFKIFSRGTYGLKSWELQRYRSVSSAIEEFIDATGLPQRRQLIIKHLEGELTEGNITAALSTETRFKSIGEGFYDRPQNWQQRTFDEFFRLLPDPVIEFARYLTGRNNTSYKLVMAFVYIRSMDEHGVIYLSKLKKNFYNFYLSRQKKGLGVEVNTAVMCRIGELTEDEIKNQACKRPIESFLKSNFFVLFSENGRKMRLADFLATELGNPLVRDVMIILLLKAIDDYYKKNLPVTIADAKKPEITIQIQEIDSLKLEVSDCPNVLSGKSNPTINIKKKRRGKIRL